MTWTDPLLGLLRRGTTVGLPDNVELEWSAAKFPKFKPQTGGLSVNPILTGFSIDVADESSILRRLAFETR